MGVSFFLKTSILIKFFLKKGKNYKEYPIIKKFLVTGLGRVNFY